MRKEDYFNNFRLQCLDLETLSMMQFDRSVASLQALRLDDRLRKIDRIIATGCGDSYLAAVSSVGAFSHFLPDVVYEAPVAVEFTRFSTFAQLEPSTLVVGISVSGSPARVVEVLKRGRKYGCLTLALTDKPESPVGISAEHVYHTNTPTGDNVAGLRTFYASMVSLFVLAAYINELRTGKEQVPKLRAQVEAYKNAVYRDINDVDDVCFQTALAWKHKKLFEVTADGPLFQIGKFISAKFAELSGDVCAVIDSENYFHVNGMMYPGEEIAEINLVVSDEANVGRLVEAVNAQVRRDKRSSIVFSDRVPDELGINQEVSFCMLAVPIATERYLLPLFAYIPAAILASYRAAVIGEPYFRGGAFFPMMNLSGNPVRVI